MSDAPDLFGPDVETLRRLLPIRVVAAYLTAEGAHGPFIDAKGEALCPFHDDTSESFYLWDGDDGIERWWCQVCNVGGSIYDLIMRSKGVNFPQAVEIAGTIHATLPPGYVPPAVTPKQRTPQVDDWTNRIDVARARAAEKDGLLAVRLGFVENSEEDRADAHEWDLYLRNTWGWGIDPDSGAVWIPHWNEKGELTGCKVRNGAAKESLPGSKYLALYGSFLGRRFRDVLLLEGESDTVYAGFHAAKEKIPLDTFGLPSGAMRPPLQEQLDFLGTGGTIYLALDPDRAGVDATRKWIAALATLGHRDIRVCSLPHTRDLRSARPTIRHLLDHAKKPLAYPDRVAQAPGGYICDTGKQDDNGNAIWRSVTSWYVEPLARLVGGDDPGYDAIIHTRETSTRTVLRLSDLASTQVLNKWANKHEMLFTGTDNDRKKIAEWIEAEGAIVPEVFQTEQVGVHAPPDDYHFAGPSYVYTDDYEGDLPWRYAPTGKASSDVHGRILLPMRAGAQAFEWHWLEAFLKLNATHVTHPMLAWLVASARRNEVVNFPLLFIGGSSGVGKSTLANIAMRLAGSAISIDLGSVTPFILLRTLASTTTFPVFVDEWTRMSRRDTRDAFQGAIPNLYFGGTAERGQQDLTSVSYHVTAPVIVAGEDTFELDRERDRTVVIYPARSTQDRDALNSIQSAPLEGFARILHAYLLTKPKDIPRLDYAVQPTRPLYNEMILQAGWATLRTMLQTHLYAGDDTAIDLPEVPDLSCFTREAAPEERENVYEAALKAGLAMRDGSGNPVVWTDSEGRGTYVRAKELIGLIETRKTDIDLPGRSRAMLGYFRERYPIDHETVVSPLTNQSLYAALIQGLLLEQPDDGEMFH